MCAAAGTHPEKGSRRDSGGGGGGGRGRHGCQCTRAEQTCKQHWAKHRMECTVACTYAHAATYPCPICLVTSDQLLTYTNYRRPTDGGSLHDWNAAFLTIPSNRIVPTPLHLYLGEAAQKALSPMALHRMVTCCAGVGHMMSSGCAKQMCQADVCVQIINRMGQGGRLSVSDIVC